MKKILILIGTRPDAIKMAPVINELKKHPDTITPIVVSTTQHRELLDDVLKIFSIKPDFDLNIMKTGQTLYHITIQILQKLQIIMKNIKPDIILVQGDTTSTFVGALAAFYEKIPIAHIEAGLRSHNKYNPYPEEMNRILTDMLTDIYFAPTKTAKNNLLKEGIASEKIWVTGNTSIDALFSILRKKTKLSDNIINSNTFMSTKKERIILVTSHRRESFNKPLEQICLALIEIKKKFKDVEIIYSVHPNPNIRNQVYKLLKGIPGINLISPPDYLHFVNLMKHSYLILTDSGGIQEEAPSLGKPVLVMRETTERKEGIEQGTAILVGTNKEKIIKEASSLLTDMNKYKKMAKLSNPYGDGKASKKIVKILLKFILDSYQNKLL
ncbi:MAG: UDP-N-acetylglucosamine 2-epimerase (non-hydrolyzing) [bacterium]|nr:UDP-N-acetylglucosamine 2-epimerase (non-hydrolyzing) [bacterium]